MGQSVTTAKPKRGYPLTPVSVGEHILKKRLDEGLTRKAAAKLIGADPDSLRNWEEGRTEIEPSFYPRLISFLGYNPLPEPRTLGQAVRRERLTRGLSRRQLAELSVVDQATVARLEHDTKGMARRAKSAISAVLDLRAWLDS